MSSDFTEVEKVSFDPFHFHESLISSPFSTAGPQNPWGSSHKYRDGWGFTVYALHMTDILFI